MERTAIVTGDSVAGLSAAALLQRMGWLVSLSNPHRGVGYPVVVNAASRYLLDRIWGSRLLADLPRHRLRARRMLWSQRSRAMLEDDTIVVDLAAMKAAMISMVKTQGAIDANGREGADWRFVATATAADAAMVLSGGARSAIAVPVALHPGANPEAMTVAAGAAGWSSLIPTGTTSAHLFAIGARATVTCDAWFEELVAETVRAEISDFSGPAAILDAAPRLHAAPWQDRGRILVGTAAIAWDPLSGDGIGVGIRTAHMAAVAANNAVSRAEAEPLKTFYADRLARAMCAHLKALLTLYAETPFAKHWTVERDAMRSMADSLRVRLERAEAAQYSISEGNLSPLV
jgi:2-polyprenyl-6-methoxyphenol hydroxylase-like FAD-dependent oxidoreductase